MESAPADWLEGVGEILRHLVAGVPAGSLVEVLSSDYELEPGDRQSVLNIASELLNNPAFRVFRTESTDPLTQPRKGIRV